MNQPRGGTQRCRPARREDEDALTQAIVQLASRYGRYGYRRITALLKRAGWSVGKDRVERIWRRKGLKVSQEQKPRGRLWLNDGSCLRLRPEHRNHVWSYDFVSTRTHDGRSVRVLNLIDEFTRECFIVRAERRWSSAKVMGALADVMVWKGVPEHLRSANGPEFVAKDLRKWLAEAGAKTLYIEPGSPWENGYCESSDSKLRDEFLNGEIFYSIKELRALAERWRVHYNTVRPHSSLSYRPPAPEARQTPDGGYLNSEGAALHCLTYWYKTSGRPQDLHRQTQRQPGQTARPRPSPRNPARRGTRWSSGNWIGSAAASSTLWISSGNFIKRASASSVSPTPSTPEPLRDDRWMPGYFQKITLASHGAEASNAT